MATSVVFFQDIAVNTAFLFQLFVESIAKKTGWLLFNIFFKQQIITVYRTDTQDYM